MYSKTQNNRRNESQFIFDSNFLINGENDQTDSNKNCLLQQDIQTNEGIIINEEHIDFLTDKAEAYWKHIAREIQMDECQIVNIERNVNIRNKLREVIHIWLNESCLNSQKENSKEKCFSILNILTACRLNKIKGNFLENKS